MPPRVTYKHGPCHPGLLQHPLTVGGVIVNTCVGGVAVRAGEEEVDFIDFTLQVHDAVLPPVRAQDSPFQNGTGHDPSDDNIWWAASLKHVMGESFPGTCLLKSRASVSFSFSRPSHTSYVSPRNLSRVYRCRRTSRVQPLAKHAHHPVGPPPRPCGRGGHATGRARRGEFLISVRRQEDSVLLSNILLPPSPSLT